MDIPADLNEQVQDRLDTIMEQMKVVEGNRELKAANQMGGVALTVFTIVQKKLYMRKWSMYKVGILF